MQISALFIQIQLCLVAHKQFMTAVTHVNGAGITLVAVAQMYAVPSATYQHRYRVSRTVREACVQHLFIVFVPDAPCYIGPPGGAIGAP